MKIQYEKDFASGKGPDFGDSLHYKGLVIILISKNCSSTLAYNRDEFRKSINDRPVEKAKAIAFLRNPIFRWKSSMLETLYRNPNKISYILNNLHQIVFEEVQTPQYLHIEYIKQYVESFEYYYIDDDGLRKFNTKHKYWDNIPHLNETIKNSKKLFFLSLLNKFYNDELEKLVRDFYKKDFELIEEVFGEHI